MAIGASAGGLTALKGLFAKVPAAPGMAFVVIQHLDPGSKSLAAEIIARMTALPAIQVADGIPVEADHIYVIPPNAYLTIEDGRLRLGEAVLQHGLRLPIDTVRGSRAEQL